jgi:phosphoribosylglycinamide formyltransferase 1
LEKSLELVLAKPETLAGRANLKDNAVEVFGSQLGSVIWTGKWHSLFCAILNAITIYMPRLRKIAILIGGRGRGSNMAALAEACASGFLPAQVVLVIAPSAGLPAIQRAQALSLEVEVIPPASEGYAGQMLSVLKKNEAEFVCLAGYLRLLPAEVLQAFPNRVLNIHPSLLPKFGGQGMYGIRVHEAVLASGEKESGCTVHLVSEQYDEGHVLLQMACPVEPGDTPEILAARVLGLEHAAYPLALKSLMEQDGS